jgi:hypothetical protein
MDQALSSISPSHIEQYPVIPNPHPIGRLKIRQLLAIRHIWKLLQLSNRGVNSFLGCIRKTPQIFNR